MKSDPKQACLRLRDMRKETSSQSFQPRKFKNNSGQGIMGLVVAAALGTVVIAGAFQAINVVGKQQSSIEIRSKVSIIVADIARTLGDQKTCEENFKGISLSSYPNSINAIEAFDKTAGLKNKFIVGQKYEGSLILKSITLSDFNIASAPPTIRGDSKLHLTFFSPALGQTFEREITISHELDAEYPPNAAQKITSCTATGLIDTNTVSYVTGQCYCHPGVISGPGCASCYVGSSSAQLTIASIAVNCPAGSEVTGINSLTLGSDETSSSYIQSSTGGYCYDYSMSGSDKALHFKCQVACIAK